MYRPISIVYSPLLLACRCPLTTGKQFKGRKYSCEDAEGRGLTGMPGCEDGYEMVDGQVILDELG